MNEVWKDIPGYEGLYQVSNFGNVKSFLIDKKNGSLRKLNTDKYGYHYIILYKNGISKTIKVHRLVAQAFIPNRDNLPEINHKDKNRKNNNSENLEWCTNLYNIQYSRAKEINQYDNNNNFIKRWNCIREASRKLKIDSGDITKCCNGKRKTAGGYIWKYAGIIGQNITKLEMYIK